ncbi:uncharacterized protein LOC121391693 isoform X2 [Gigantopelta aegis]|uniref:uncharacterized protein LOC121391693 isoform X2 n=1 Tax=Gigantopelta aegis TaxID=1735272 RepID=UPI001B888F1B|nr:uncharacterized protein LOC121391693 isoform X2 [Gigantopelta aegis]
MLRHVWVFPCILRLGGTFSNVAFQKPATMSTVIDVYAIASHAVDGYTYICAQTNYSDMEPWWMVDLRGYFDIHDVNVTSVYDWFTASGFDSLRWVHWAISRTRQCSTTGVTKAVCGIYTASPLTCLRRIQ